MRVSPGLPAPHPQVPGGDPDLGPEQHQPAGPPGAHTLCLPPPVAAAELLGSLESWLGSQRQLGTSTSSDSPAVAAPSQRPARTGPT